MGQLELFESRLPRFAYATQEKGEGVYRYPALEALKYKLIEYNSNSIGYLCYDLDSDSTVIDFLDSFHLPKPNILVINPANNHGHALYSLTCPVHRNQASNPAPLRYLASIDIAMTETLIKADPGYNKLLCKNPMHPSWLVLYPRERPYTLSELADYLDLKKYGKRKPLPAIGLGRNCTLFDTVRAFSYSERRKPGITPDTLYQSILARAHEVNAGFTSPLSGSEVRGVVRSITKWSWKHITPEGFIEYQRNAGKRSGYARAKKAIELRNRILDAHRQVPGLTQADLAALIGCKQPTVSKYLRLSPNHIKIEGLNPHV